MKEKPASPFVELAGYRFQLLDPPLFWRKLILLVVFFAGFVFLKAYERRVELLVYVIFLLALHVYILFVFLWRVRWRVFAENRRAFAIRLVAILVFVLLLTLIKFDVPAWEFFLAVALSLGIHVALLLSLTVDVRPAAEPLKTES